MVVEMPTMEPALTLEMRPCVSPSLVAYAGMLALSSPELEEVVERELSENPALERAEAARCPFCGSGDRAGCCGGWPPDPRLALARGTPAPSSVEPAADWPAARTDAEQLLEELRWSASAADFRLASYVLASLDDHGFLRGGPELIAAELKIGIPDVERALTLLRNAGPPGIGARDLRESLLLQLRVRCLPGPADEMARVIADGYLELLGRGRLDRVAAALGCDEAQVAAAHEVIRTRCSPFPAPGMREPRHMTRQPALPDVVISAGEGSAPAFHVELIEPARFAMRVEPNYGRLAALISQAGPAPEPAGCDRELHAHVGDFVRRAATFIARLDERFRTIRRVVEYAADRQRDFVLDGPRYLRPLSQADVARDLGVHESTVSRAVAGKYMMMPSHAVLPIQDFFRAALAPQEALRQLIAAEERPLSDAELARRLSAEGFPVARRTVAKYRDELGVPAAPLRPPSGRGAAKRVSR
jgi:RNA polymerase sigma-54 factor